MSVFIVIQDPKTTYAQYIKEDLIYLNIDKDVNIDTYQVYQVDREIDNLEDVIGPYKIYRSLESFDTGYSFRYRNVQGQFNEHEEMLNAMLKDLGYGDIHLHHCVIIKFEGLDEKEIDVFKKYYINRVENEIVGFEKLDYSAQNSPSKDCETVSSFTDFTIEEIKDLKKDYSMSVDDLKLVQKYFRDEGRNPSIFELKVIDTYWSDHCRHTTFNTILTDISVSDGKYKEVIEDALRKYLDVRKTIYENPDEKNISLMNIATINSKYERYKGNLEDIDISDEVNACCVNIQVDVDDKKEDWLLYFKNETHNHPTEIEPFGGASTCIGGGIRDPLSGRANVHQAMRITGAKDPRTPYEKTLKNKLSQRTICKKAMEGSADYCNKYGLPAGYAREYYDDAFQAKRLETGALLAATPKKNVVRKKTEDGDLVVLLGGKTGRDGLGAAVGSSKIHTSTSLTLQGAEVQKGNPIIQRKIQRLFKNPDATRLIKKCNDFGAGGVSVAVGEISEGIQMYLDKVPVKYDGLEPSEIALSESQERMAVVVAQKDIDKFISLADSEDVSASIVGRVNDSGFMTMTYNGEQVLKLSRDFLNSNGAKRYQNANINGKDISNLFTTEKDISSQLQDINNASQKPMGMHFDSTVGKNTVLGSYGGKYRITEQLGMASKIPVDRGYTATISVMTMGYFPEILKKSTFHGGYYSVLESICRIVALGVKREDVRLSLQEFFPSPSDNPEKWGLVTGALLGAFKVMYDLEIAAIGGKDSMSGTYEDIDVPPTLISFAVGTTKINRLISRELKSHKSKVVLLSPSIPSFDYDIPDSQEIKTILTKVTEYIEKGYILSISTLGHKTVENNLVEMALGNRIGFEMNKDYIGKIIPCSFLMEVDKDLEIDGIVVAYTNDTTTAAIDKNYNLEDLTKIYVNPLEQVYGKVNIQKEEVPIKAKDKKDIKSKAKVLIPVITGSYGEQDLYKTFSNCCEKVDYFVIKEEKDFENSIEEFKNLITSYDIVALPDGAVYGNQIFAGKAVELILRKIAPEINEFVKKGYIFASGNSALGLIRSGLIENSEISSSDIKIHKNAKNEYISEIVTGKVIDKTMSDLDYYTTVLSSDTFEIELGNEKNSGIIVSQIDLGGKTIVDAVMDSTGHIFATISNIERFDRDLMVNIDVQEADFIEKFVEKVGK